jgi:hypothetical protein
MAENKNIVQINENEWEVAEKTYHQMLESLASVYEAKKH